MSTLPDIKTRQLAGLYSQNFVGKPSSEKKIKILSAVAAKNLKKNKKSPISPDELKGLAEFLSRKYKTKAKKFRR